MCRILFIIHLVSLVLVELFVCRKQEKSLGLSKKRVEKKMDAKVSELLKTRGTKMPA